MKSVTCVVVGDWGVFGVDIDESKKVWHLKKMIKEENVYSFSAKRLTLFLAKKGSNWMNPNDPDIIELERGHITAGIESTMNDANKMNETSIISEFGFPDDDDAESGGQIHILVDLPQSVKNILHYDQQERRDEWLSGTGLPSASLWHWLHTLFSAEKASHAKKDA